jgi:autotransporter-associated beta strand protein
LGGDGIWETGLQGGWDATWTAADTATFSGPGGTVTLQSAVSAGVPLSFSTGDYILQSNDATERVITLGAITQGTGVTTTIGSKATIASAIQWAVDGVSTADNTFIIENGGKLSNSSGLLTVRETTLNIKTGGLLSNNNSTIVGDTADGAIVNVQGGTLTIPATGGTNLILGNGAVTSTVTIKITGGEISITNAGNTGGIRYGGNAAGDTTGIFDLDGGVVTVNKVYEATSGVINSTFNFNGGTLKAFKTNTTDFMTGLDAANVKSLGAKIDSAAFNITIAQSLLDGGGAGGLTKSGTGALTLSGTNTYTGTTSVNAGTLKLNYGVGGTDATKPSDTAALTLAALTLAGGSDWAANSTNLADGTVTAFSAYTDLSDSAVIADRPNTNVRINSNGGGGSMTLGSTTTSINSLLQNNSGQPAIVDLLSTNTLATSAIMIGTTAKGLTVGTVPADDTLTPGTGGTYVIATYTGTRFGALGGTLPPGDTVNYDDANKEIELIVVGSAYDTWGAPYGLATGSEGGDLDNDGLANQQEFAFGLIPNDGSSVNPIISPLSKTSGQLTYQILTTSGSGTIILSGTNGYTEATTISNGELRLSITGSTLTWSAVPEPTSALAGLLVGAGLLRRRRA